MFFEKAILILSESGIPGLRVNIAEAEDGGYVLTKKIHGLRIVPRGPFYVVAPSGLSVLSHPCIPVYPDPMAQSPEICVINAREREHVASLLELKKLLDTDTVATAGVATIRRSANEDMVKEALKAWALFLE